MLPSGDESDWRLDVSRISGLRVNVRNYTDPYVNVSAPNRAARCFPSTHPHALVFNTVRLFGDESQPRSSQRAPLSLRTFTLKLEGQWGYEPLPLHQEVGRTVPSTAGLAYETREA